MPLTEVFCRTTFEGFHCWPDAPEEVAFLRDLHRHIFHVEVYVGVQHGDRDVEFIMLKRGVDEAIAAKRMLGGVGNWSCEMWADYLLQSFGATKVMVSEDGENGAWVYATA